MSDSLFSLIKAMTTAEKIHFKRSMKKQAGYKEPAYLKLFDVIDTLDAFDKAVILKKLKVKKITADYTELKAYLRDLLIDFLENYNSEKSVERKAGKLLRKSQTLFDKGLYDDANEFLQRADELSKTYQLFNLMHRIHARKITLLWAGSNANRYELMSQKFSEQKEAIQGLLLTNQIERVFELLHLLIMEAPSSRDEEILRQATELHHSIKDVPETSFFYPQLLRLLSHSFYHNLVQDYDSLRKNYKTAIQLYDANQQMKKRYGSYYLNILKNYLLVLHYFRDYSAYGQLLIFLSDSVQNLRGHLKTFPALFLIFLKLDILITKGENESALQFANTNNPKIKLSENIFDASIQLKLFQQYAFIYFFNNDYKRANHYVNKLNNEFKLQRNGSADLVFSIKIIKLIITYELQDYELLNNLLISTQQYFYRHNKLHKLESLLFKHFKTLIGGDEKNNAAWSQLKIVLSGFDSYFLLEFMGFDILAWIDSKMQNRSMNSVLKEKAEQQYPDIFKINIHF